MRRNKTWKNNIYITIDDLIKELQKLPQNATIGIARNEEENGYTDWFMDYISKNELAQLIKSVENWNNKDCCFNIDNNDNEVKLDYYINID